MNHLSAHINNHVLHQYKVAVVLVLSLFFLTGCNVDYEAMAENRIKYATTNQREIVIAAIHDAKKSSYIKGIRLAVEEINKNAGGLLGRPLKLQIEPSSKDFKSAKSVIRRIIANPKVSVVMGHQNEKIALPASVIYEKGKVLFFPPFATAKNLTSHQLVYTFRMLPDDAYLAKQMSTVARLMGYKNTAIIYSGAKQHHEFNLTLGKELTEQGLNVGFNRSFLSHEVDFRSLLSDLKKESFDAVFLSAETATTIQLVKQVREMGVHTPIFVSGNIDLRYLAEKTSNEGNKVIASTLYDQQSSYKPNQMFKTRYRNNYQELPDVSAAQGYDSVMLFANKVTRTRSTVPSLLASTVHFSPVWRGVTGTHFFNKKGDMLGKKYYFQVLNNGRWHRLPNLPQ